MWTLFWKTRPPFQASNGVDTAANWPVAGFHASCHLLELAPPVFPEDEPTKVEVETKIVRPEPPTEEIQAQMVSLQQRWDDERNHSFALMGELDAAERRLLSLFSGEWEARGGERRMINLAYSEFRKRLCGRSGCPRGG